jgi:hypothetical protein
MATATISYYDLLEEIPWPESWHMDDTPEFTEEMWDSVQGNWDRAQQAIEDIPMRHLERIKAEEPEYWKEQREMETGIGTRAFSL